MNPPPPIPAASSDFDLEQGRQTKGYEDCNADPKKVLSSEKGSRADGCEFHNANLKELLVRLRAILYNGTLSHIRRSCQILQSSMLTFIRIAEACIPARAAEVQRLDTIGPYQTALCSKL